MRIQAEPDPKHKVDIILIRKLDLTYLIIPYVFWFEQDNFKISYLFYIYLKINTTCDVLWGQGEFVV